MTRVQTGTRVVSLVTERVSTTSRTCDVAGRRRRSGRRMHRLGQPATILLSDTADIHPCADMYTVSMYYVYRYALLCMRNFKFNNNINNML